MLFQDCVEPFRSFLGIHGCNGVTDVLFSEDTLITAGRDGRVLLFSAKERELQFMRVFWVSCVWLSYWAGSPVSSNVVLPLRRERLLLICSAQVFPPHSGATSSPGEATRRRWPLSLGIKHRSTYGASAHDSEAC